ncbi:Hypothetical_protein [Hexamita inflata]|uniref:Hypothetical_protein n=1 Tax=Hexamita inflata TaxID=28002 RepID=A0AA86TS72_9EUKA|nr:Hypothetical protein HINF_LOCUS14311 [Hexamita inflata]
MLNIQLNQAKYCILYNLKNQQSSRWKLISYFNCAQCQIKIIYVCTTVLVQAQNQRSFFNSQNYCLYLIVFDIFVEYENHWLPTRSLILPLGNFGRSTQNHFLLRIISFQKLIDHYQITPLHFGSSSIFIFKKRKIRRLLPVQSLISETYIESNIFNRSVPITNGFFEEILITFTRSKLFTRFQNLCKLGVEKIAPQNSTQFNISKDYSTDSPQSLQFFDHAYVYFMEVVL